MNEGSFLSDQSLGCEATATKNIQTIDHYASFLTTSDEKYRKIHDKIFDVETSRYGKEFIQQILIDNDSLRKSREKLLEICRPLAQQNAEYAKQLQALKKQCENTSKMCVAWQHAKDQMYLLFKKTEKESEEKSKKLEVAHKSVAQLRRLLAIKTKKKTNGVKKNEDASVNPESSSSSTSDLLTQQNLDSTKENERTSSAASTEETVTATNADDVSSDEELNLCEVISAWSIKKTESTSTRPQISNLESNLPDICRKAVASNKPTSTKKMNRPKHAVKKTKKGRRKTVNPEPFLSCDKISYSSSNASSDPMLDLVDDFDMLNTVPSSECNKPSSKRLIVSPELPNPALVNVGKNKFTTPFVPPTTSHEVKPVEAVADENKLPFKLPESSSSKQKKKTKMKNIPTVVVPRNLRSRKSSNLDSILKPPVSKFPSKKPPVRTNCNAAIKIESSYETIFDDLEISDSDSSLIQDSVPPSQVPISPVKKLPDVSADPPSGNAIKPSSKTLDSVEDADTKIKSNDSKRFDMCQLSSDDDYSSYSGNNLLLSSSFKSPSIVLSSDEILATPPTKSPETSDAVCPTKSLSDTSISSVDLSENAASDAVDGVASPVKSPRNFDESFNACSDTKQLSPKSVPASNKIKTLSESSSEIEYSPISVKLPVRSRRKSVKSVNVSPKLVRSNRIKTLNESSSEMESSATYAALPVRSCKKSAKSVNVSPKLVSVNRIKTLSESSCEIDSSSEKSVISPVGPGKLSSKSAITSAKSVKARKIKALSATSGEIGHSPEVSNDITIPRRVLRKTARDAVEKVTKPKRSSTAKQSKKLSKSPPQQKVPTINNKTSDFKYKSEHLEGCDAVDRLDTSISRISPTLMESKLTLDQIPSTTDFSRNQFIGESELTESEMLRSPQMLSSVELGRKDPEMENIIAEKLVNNSDGVKCEKSDKRKRKGKKCDSIKSEAEIVAEENSAPNLENISSRKLQQRNIKTTNCTEEIHSETILDETCDGTPKTAALPEWNSNKNNIEGTKLCFMDPFSVDTNVELQGINVSTPPEDTELSDIDIGSPNMISPPLSPYSPVSSLPSICISPQHYSTSPLKGSVTSPMMEIMSTCKSHISQENNEFAISFSNEDKLAKEIVPTEVEKSLLSLDQSSLSRTPSDGKHMNEKSAFFSNDNIATDQEVEECFQFDLDVEDLWNLLHDEFPVVRLVSPLPVNDPVNFLCPQIDSCKKKSNDSSDIACLQIDLGEKKLTDSLDVACSQTDSCEKKTNDLIDVTCPQTFSFEKSNDPKDIAYPQSNTIEKVSNDPIDITCPQSDSCRKKSNDLMDVAHLQTDSCEKITKYSPDIACPQSNFCEKKSNDLVDLVSPQTDPCEKKSNGLINVVCSESDSCGDKSNYPTDIACPQSDLCNKKSNEPSDVACLQTVFYEKKSNDSLDIVSPQSDSCRKKCSDTIDVTYPQTDLCEKKSNDPVDFASPQVDLCEKKLNGKKLSNPIDIFCLQTDSCEKKSNDSLEIACPPQSDSCRKKSSGTIDFTYPQTDWYKKKSNDPIDLVSPQVDSCEKKLNGLMNVACPQTDLYEKKSNDLIDIFCLQRNSSEKKANDTMDTACHQTECEKKSNDPKDITCPQTDSCGKISNGQIDISFPQTDSFKKKSKLKPAVKKLKLNLLDSSLSQNSCSNFKSSDIQKKSMRKSPICKKRNSTSSNSCKKVVEAEISSVCKNLVSKKGLQNSASTGESDSKNVVKVGSIDSSESGGSPGTISGADNFTLNVKSVSESIAMADSIKRNESSDLVSDRNASKYSSMKAAALTSTVKQRLFSSLNTTHYIALSKSPTKLQKRCPSNSKVAIPKKRLKETETSTNNASNSEPVELGVSSAVVKNMITLQYPNQKLRSTPIKSLGNPTSSCSKKRIASSKSLTSSQNRLTLTHTDSSSNVGEENAPNGIKSKISDIFSNNCIKFDNPKPPSSSNTNCNDSCNTEVFVLSTQDSKIGSNNLSASEKHSVEAVRNNLTNCKVSFVSDFKTHLQEVAASGESSATALSNKVIVQNENLELSTSASINNDAPVEAGESNNEGFKESFSLVPKSIKILSSVKPEAQSEWYECERNCLRTCFKYYKEEHCIKFIEDAEKRKQRADSNKKLSKKYLSKDMLRKTLTDLTKPSETWSDLAAASLKNLENLNEKLVVDCIIKHIEEDKSDINEAIFPPSTTTQKLLLVLCHKLVASHPTLIESILKATEKILFNWDSPLKEESQQHDRGNFLKGENQMKKKTKAQLKLEREPKKICNLSAFFTLTCKSLGQLQRCRSFIYDALYMSVHRAHLIIHSVLSVWPIVFLHSSKSTECPLTMVTVFEIFSHKHSDTYGESRRKKGPTIEATDPYKVEVLKSLLYQYYGYSNPQLSQVTRGSIMTTLTPMFERPGCVEAFVLLAKRGLWEWAASKMVFGFLFPLLEDFKAKKISEAQAKVVVKIIGLVTRAFPLGTAWLEMKKVLALLESLLIDEKLGTTSFKEAIVISVVQLYRADPDFCLSILSKWNPSDGKFSVEFLENVKSMFYGKKLTHWYQQISAIGSSV